MKIRQIKIPAWIGGLQVQFGNSLAYLTIVNTFMLGMTFWYTAGYQIASTYAPWANLWLFLSVCAVVAALVMVFDYTVMYPARQSFINSQACKHNNPWMDEILEQKKDIAKIKIKLGIED
jgi:hypothetical protein